MVELDNALMDDPAAIKLKIMHSRTGQARYEAVDVLVSWCRENGSGRYALDHWYHPAFPTKGFTFLWFDDPDTAFWCKMRFG
jgi:hypothetical protein